MLRLHAQGIGILMTTHFPDHALYLRAQTLVLKDKIRWKHGAVEDVIDEASMTELCELPVHIGSIDTRTVCVGGVLPEEMIWNAKRLRYEVYPRTAAFLHLC